MALPRASLDSTYTVGMDTAVEAPRRGRPRANRPPIDPARVNHAVKRLRDAIEAGKEDGVQYPPAVANALLQLTLKQRRYCLHRATGYPMVTSYRAAYDVAAHRADRELCGEVNAVEENLMVANALISLTNWLDADWLLDVMTVRSFTLSKLYDEAEHADKAGERIAATKLLMQAHGLLVARSEVTIRDGDKADTQAAIFDAILSQIGLNDAIEAQYVVQPMELASPVARLDVCPNCGHQIARDSVAEVATPPADSPSAASEPHLPGGTG